MFKYTVLMIFSIFGCSSQGQDVQSNRYALTLKSLLSHSVPEISVADFNEERDGYVILDSRKKEEFDVSIIEGARYVGYEDFEIKSISDLDKNSKIMVYCSVGYRSEKIAEKLIEAGFHNVTNLYGGIFEWKNQGNDVVDTSGKTTEKVHAFDRIWGVFLNKGEKVY